MNCPRCGKPIPNNAAFCLHCGTALVQAAPAPAAATASAMPVDFQAQAKRRSLVMAALVAFAIVGVFAFGAKTILAARSANDARTLQANGALPDGRVLQATGATPSGVLMAPGQKGGSVMEATAKAPEQMPQDVYNWLKHLEKCEKMKVELAGDQTAEVSLWVQKNSVLGAGMGLTDPYDQSGSGDNDKDPGTYTKGKILDLRHNWLDLYRFFRSVPPPAECVPIANDFDKAMSEIPGMMGDLGDILNTVGQDPESAMKNLKKMQNSSYGEIDRSFVRCDGKVGDICSKYHVNKWFNIKSDVMAGGVIGKVNLPGGVSGGMPQIP